MSDTSAEKDTIDLIAAARDVMKAMDTLIGALLENGARGARGELADVQHHESWYFALREKVFGPDGT